MAYVLAVCVCVCVRLNPALHAMPARRCVLRIAYLFRQSGGAAVAVFRRGIAQCGGIPVRANTFTHTSSDSSISSVSLRAAAAS